MSRTTSYFTFQDQSVTSFDIHIEKDTIGSSLRFTK